MRASVLVCIGVFVGLSASSAEDRATTTLELGATAVEKCPSGPYRCVGPGIGGGTGGSPPGPRFMEVEPYFIDTDAFEGYFARGTGGELSIIEGELPGPLMDAMKKYDQEIKDGKMYIVTDDDKEIFEDTYIMFKGVSIDE